MPTQRSETSTPHGGEPSDAVRLLALEREVARLKRLLRARRPARREYADLEVDDLEEELDDFDEDELGIDPEEGL